MLPLSVQKFNPKQMVIFNPVLGQCFEHDVPTCNTLEVYQEIRRLNSEISLPEHLCDLWLDWIMVPSSS
jgi:hypothetical protein